MQTKANQDVELKTCPFCGGDGGIYYHGEDYSGSSQVDVGCTAGCSITPRAVGDTDPDAEQDEAWAIAVWNTRTTSSAPPEVEDARIAAAVEAEKDRGAAGLAWGENPNREPGKIHIEWHAPCGCAFHPKPFPHVHPCTNEHKRPDLHALTERDRA